MTDLFNRTETTNLLAAWQVRKQTIDAEKFQPYADLLLDTVVWPEIVSKKNDIYTALQDAIKTASHTYELTVPVWSFNTVFGQKMLSSAGTAEYRRLLEADDPDAMVADWINHRGWNYQMKVEVGDTPALTLPRMSLYPIIKKTTFLDELSLRFGSGFRVTLDSRPWPSWTVPNGRVVVCTLFTLNLHYHPYGLSDALETSLESMRAKLETRARRSLLPNETLSVIHGTYLLKKVVATIPTAVLNPETYSGMRTICHCNYHADTESETETETESDEE